MSTDREFLINQLARQVLSMGNPDGSRPRVTPGVTDAASAKLRVEIEGMVTGMTRQIWIDQGAWTEKIVAEIERLASELDLDVVIARHVRAEVDRTMSQVDQLIRERVKAQIHQAVDEKIKGYAKAVADAVADRMLKEVFP